MAKRRPTEVTVLEAARLLGRRLDSTYRAIWERSLTARKDGNGNWLVSVASIDTFKEKAKRLRQTHRPRRTPAPEAATATA